MEGVGAWLCLSSLFAEHWPAGWPITHKEKRQPTHSANSSTFLLHKERKDKMSFWLAALPLSSLVGRSLTPQRKR